MAWSNPRFGTGEKLIGWVTFDKFCLMEFLSVSRYHPPGRHRIGHAYGGWLKRVLRIFWGLIIFYFILGTSAYLFHRDHGALIGFYAILVTRGLGILSLQTADQDMLRAEVLKNMLMFVPMMILVGVLSFGDGFGTSWRETFIQGRLGFVEKIVQGRNLLFVTAYYILWAVVTWKWPLRIANK